MQSKQQDRTISELEINRAVHFAIVEIIFGSLGHGFKIPFTGHFLSIYQLNILANGINKDGLPRSSSVEVSGIVGVLKSLSPAGNKIGPMFSIMTQGALFWFGTLIGGTGLLGQLLGAAFLSAWAFIQPLITYTLIFGFDFFRMIQHYITKMNLEYPFAGNFLVGFVLMVLSIKLVISILVILKSYFGKAEWLIDTQKFHFIMLKQDTTKKSAWIKALRDLTNPIFLISFVLMLFFSIQMGKGLNAISLMAIRSIASAFIIFYLIRSSWLSKKLDVLSKSSPAFMKLNQKASQVLKSIDGMRKE